MTKINYKKEVCRKLLHLAGYWNIIIFLVVSELFDAPKVAFLILTLILLLFIELEYMRVEHHLVSIPSQFNIFREKEQSTFGGHIYMTLAAIVCFAAFDVRIASAAFSMTILGDIASALVGRRFGKHTFIHSNKTWEGTIAGFCSNCVAGYIFLYPLSSGLIILILMAFVASLVEVLTQKLDDNLTVAIFAGAVGQGLMLILIQFTT